MTAAPRWPALRDTQQIAHRPPPNLHARTRPVVESAPLYTQPPTLHAALRWQSSWTALNERRARFSRHRASFLGLFRIRCPRDRLVKLQQPHAPDRRPHMLETSTLRGRCSELQPPVQTHKHNVRTRRHCSTLRLCVSFWCPPPILAFCTTLPTPSPCATRYHGHLGASLHYTRPTGCRHVHLHSTAIGHGPRRTVDVSWWW